MKMIATNAGLEGSVIVDHVKGLEGPNGFNAGSEEYEDLIAAGVIDPAKVTRIALENAASIAGMFLTTETVIVEEKEDTPPMPPMGGGMGGMM